MAGGFSTAGDDELISGINVTPLVDVILVLLIIFLITAPVIYQSAIKVQLPKAASGEQAQKSALAFTLSKDGQLAWNGEKLDWKTLSERLAQRKPTADSAQESATVGADEGTPHGLVVKLMDALRQAGIQRFALSVESIAPGSTAGRH